MVGRAQILAEAHQVILSRSRVLSLILKRNDRIIPQTIIEKMQKSFSLIQTVAISGVFSAVSCWWLICFVNLSKLVFLISRFSYFHFLYLGFILSFCPSQGMDSCSVENPREKSSAVWLKNSVVEVPTRFLLPIHELHIPISQALWFEFQRRKFFVTCCYVSFFFFFLFMWISIHVTYASQNLHDNFLHSVLRNDVF